eukprot:Skav230906  [mRNA]  locus=scaffold3693:74068:75429:- [translate_table: standard]
MESQRSALCAKGSAGLKPCAFCADCLAKDAESTAERADFHTIAEPDISAFTKHTQASLQRYLREHINNLPRTTKKNKDLREKCLGYRITPDGMWTSDACCNTLPLNRFVNDSMHLYFANGIVCTEIQLLLSEVQRVTGKTVDDVKATVLDAGWVRPKHSVKEGENAYWCKRLFKVTFFTGTMYKGSASQTRALAPLLSWLAESVWQHMPLLRDAALSFLALHRCVQCLKTLNQTKNFALLSELQRAHQIAFAKVWSKAIRPKHHHRLHLSEQYIATGCIPTCWGPESKHKDYKGIFASHTQHLLTEKDGGSQFSLSLLPRLLNRHADMLRDASISVQGWSLENPFSHEQVFRETNIRDCSIASTCKVGAVRFCEGDMILWGQNAEHAARCGFFLEKEGQLFVHVTPYRLVNTAASQKTFLASNNNDVVKWSTLQAPHLCSWWKEAGAHILCLP